MCKYGLLYASFWMDTNAVFLYQKQTGWIDNFYDAGIAFVCGCWLIEETFKHLTSIKLAVSASRVGLVVFKLMTHLSKFGREMRLGLISFGKKISTWFSTTSCIIFLSFCLSAIVSLSWVGCQRQLSNKLQPKAKNVKHFTGRQNTVTAEADHTVILKKTVACTNDTSRWLQENSCWLKCFHILSLTFYSSAAIFFFTGQGFVFLFFSSPREVCLVTYSTRLRIKRELFGAV